MAKDSDDEEKDRVVGIAMWMPPRPVELKETWGEWWDGWKMWASQVGMNLWYGRGGLNVKVCTVASFVLVKRSIEKSTRLLSNGS